MVVYGCHLTITMDGKRLSWLSTAHNLENKHKTCPIQFSCLVNIRVRLTLRIENIQWQIFQCYIFTKEAVFLV